MKILIVRNASAHDFGGAERLAVHLAEELQKNNLEPLVVSRHKKLLSYAKQNDIPHVKGWWWSRQSWSSIGLILLPLYLMWLVGLIVWYIILINKKGADVVHLMSKDDFIAGSVAARFLNKQIVWTDPADLKHIFRNHSVWYKNPIGKIVYASSFLAHYIGLVSESERQLVRNSLGKDTPENFHVMHLAGRDELITPVVRDKSDSDSIIFIATSRLVRDKGIAELIEAFKSISQDKNYRLWLVGDGPDRGKFEMIAKNARDIVFLGHQKNPLSFVAAADIFVHPTYHEGFSLSLTEAAMLGKPMIATNVGGNPELVNPANGVLVPVKDSDKLSSAMRKLAEDKKLRDKLGNMARKDYKEHFDFSVLVKKRLIPIYNGHTELYENTNRK